MLYTIIYSRTGRAERCITLVVNKKHLSQRYCERFYLVTCILHFFCLRKLTIFWPMKIHPQNKKFLLSSLIFFIYIRNFYPVKVHLKIYTYKYQQRSQVRYNVTRRGGGGENWLKVAFVVISRTLHTRIPSTRVKRIGVG